MSRCDRQVPRPAVQRTHAERAPVRETKVTLPGPSAGRRRGCRSAATATELLKRMAVRFALPCLFFTEWPYLDFGELRS
jgi:hypothetical protein